MDDYREHRIQYGQYAGIHRVYWNSSICKQYEKIDNVKRWAIDREIAVGEWVESLDGSCCQLIAKRTHIDSKGRAHTFHRFPMCTITSYYTMKGEYRYNNFFASLAARNGDIPYRRGETGYHQKIRFISFILAGINPLKAYRIAFDYYTTVSIASLHRKITKILTDKDIQMEIQKQLTPFIEELESRLTEKSLIEELDLLIRNSKKGSREHRENLEFVLKLLNKIPSNGSAKQIEQASYEEVPLPQLNKKESTE